MNEDNMKKIEKQSCKISSAAKDDLPQQISSALNALLDSRPENFERIDLEAEPVTTWRFKITLVPKKN